MSYSKEEVVKVFVTFQCGHTLQTETPSVQDPAGVWLDQPRCPDGTIRVQEIWQDCYTCRSIEATNKWKEEQRRKSIPTQGANAIETIPAEGA